MDSQQELRDPLEAPGPGLVEAPALALGDRQETGGGVRKQLAMGSRVRLEIIETMESSHTRLAKMLFSALKKMQDMNPT